MDDVEDSKPTDLESLKFNKLCRICGMENSQFMQIYGTEGRDHDIASKINQHFPMISVSEADQLPLQVCYQCASTLLLFHTLYDVCAKTDKQLRDMWRQATGCVDSDDEDPSFGNIDTLGPDSDDDVSDDGGGAKAKGSARSMRSVEKRQQRSFDLSTDGFSMSDDENTMDTSNALDPNVVIEEIGGDDDVLGGENSGFKFKRKRGRPKKNLKDSTIKNKGIKGDSRKKKVSIISLDNMVRKISRKLAGNSIKSVKNEAKRLKNKGAGSEKITQKKKPVRRESKCEFCHEILQNHRQLYAHLNEKHYEELAFPCEHCELRFDTYTRKKFHRKKAHPESHPKRGAVYICGKCGMEFRSASYYQLHLEGHTGKYTCKVCGMVYGKLAELSKHRMQIHANVECALCEKRYEDKVRLASHIKIVHGPKMVCNICGLKLTKSHYKDHMMKHNGERNYMCFVCGASYIQRSDFNRHIAREKHSMVVGNENIKEDCYKIDVTWLQEEEVVSEEMVTYEIAN